MRIYIGADHRGFELKSKLIKWLQTQGHEVVDCGNTKYDPEDDYVDFAKRVATKLKQQDLEKQDNLGILICGSGVGVSIAANRYKGVRCGLGFDPRQVGHIRENDHANILALPANYINYEKTKELVKSFLYTKPSAEEKYKRRINKLDKD